MQSTFRLLVLFGSILTFCMMVSETASVVPCRKTRIRETASGYQVEVEGVWYMLKSYTDTEIVFYVNFGPDFDPCRFFYKVVQTVSFLFVIDYLLGACSCNSTQLKQSKQLNQSQSSQPASQSQGTALASAYDG